MRLAIVTSSYPRDAADSSNAGVFVRDCAELLTGLGHDVVVLTPQPAAPAADYDVQSFRWPGSETSLSHVDIRRTANAVRLGVLMLSGIWACLRTVRGRRVEHVIAMWAVPSGLLALVVKRLLGVPYSVWALGSDIWRIDDYPLGRRLLRWVLLGADSLYADGLALARDVEAIAGRPCEFLPTSRRLPCAPLIGKAARRRGRVLCVARFHPHKGVDVLVDAMSRLPAERRGSVSVNIFGGGPDEASLRELVRTRGIEDVVRIGGYVDRDELIALLRSATCLVVPSRIESIPLVLSDAAQAACPVIVTAVGDMGELVREHEVGDVVPSEDPDALAAAIVRMCDGVTPVRATGFDELASRLSLEASLDRLVERIERASG